MFYSDDTTRPQSKTILTSPLAGFGKEVIQVETPNAEVDNKPSLAKLVFGQRTHEQLVIEAIRKAAPQLERVIAAWDRQNRNP